MVAVGFLRPALGLLGQAVQQPACRVLAMREHLAIEDRCLEVGNLQPRQHHLHRRGQVAVLQDELEQHADQVDRVLVHAGHVAGPFAAQGADLGQQLGLELQDLAAERRGIVGFVVADRSAVADLALQHAERAQQFIDRRQRSPGCCRAASTGDAATAGCAPAGTEQRVQGMQQVVGDFGAVVHDSRRRRGRSARRGAAAALGLAAAQQAVAQLRQHAGADQLRVDLLVQLLQQRQHVAVEQLVDDQLDAHVRAEFLQRFAERLGQRGRRHRVAGVLDLVAAADHRQALVDREQVAREARVVLADHAGDRQRFFQVAFGHEGQLGGAERGCSCRHGGLAGMRQIAELASDGVEEVALDAGAAFAYLAHAVEVVHLRRVVLGFLGQVEQGVVDLLEGIAHPLLQTLVGDAAHGIEQLAHALAGRVQALTQVDYPGWLIGLVHRPVPLTCSTHGRFLQACAEADNKPIRARLSCPFPPAATR